MGKNKDVKIDIRWDGDGNADVEMQWEDGKSHTMTDVDRKDIGDKIDYRIFDVMASRLYEDMREYEGERMVEAFEADD